MKKFIAIILVVFLLVLAACSNTEAGSVDRWNDEAHEYFIRFIDVVFNDKGAVDRDESERGAIDYSKPGAGMQARADEISPASRYSYSITYKQPTQEIPYKHWELKQNTTLIEKFYFEKIADKFDAQNQLEFDIFGTAGWHTRIPAAGFYVFGSDEKGQFLEFTSTAESTVLFREIKSGGTPISSSKTVKSIFVHHADTTAKDATTAHGIWYNNFTVTVDYNTVRKNHALTKFTDHAGNWDEDIPAGTVVESGTGVSTNVMDNEMFIFAARAFNLDRLGGSETLTMYNGLLHSQQTIALSSIKSKLDEKDVFVVQMGPAEQLYPYLLYFENPAKATIRPSVASIGLVKGFSLLQFSQGYLMYERV